jgi:succinate dehydrogenase/fumarate reductase flavoprotein subunit
VHVTPVDAPSVAERLAEGLNATLRTGTEVTELRVDTDGRVVGVNVRPAGDATASITAVSAESVVVATGGFMHDLERVRAVRPDLPQDEMLYASWAGADGNGLDLVAPLDAATENLEAVGLYAHGVARPGTDHEELVAMGLWRSPWVNAAGERFMDEAARNSFRAGATRATQPGGRVWAIVDDVMLRDSRFAIPGGSESVDASEVLAAGTGVQAMTLAALAEATAVPADVLAASIAEYNAFAHGEQDDPWRTERTEAQPVLTAPYTAFPVGVSVAKGFGGVDVDLRGRVLTRAGAPVAGLYACGELTGMAGGTLVGDYGFTGSLTAVVLGGRVAGEQAATDALDGR